MDANPAKRRFFVVCMVSFFYQADRLQNVCDIIKPSNLCLEFLSLLKANDIRAKQDLLVLFCQLRI